MNVTVTQELKPGSVVRLSFKVKPEEINRVYQKVQDKYLNQIQLPGFRRGKVPLSIIEKKFGDALRAETARELVNETLSEFLPKAEHQPIPFDEPRLVDSELQLKLDEELHFNVEYDTYPNVQVPSWKGIEVEEPQVTVSDEDIAEKLKQLQEENGIVATKTEGGAAENDIVTIDYHEIDEQGKTVPGSERQDHTITLGKNQTIYDIDRNLAGLKEGDELTFTKEYPADYAYPELAEKTLNLWVKVKALKTMKLPDLDDDFAQDISDRFKTLDDLKSDLRKNLEEQLDDKITELKINALLDKVLEKVTIELPRSMLAYNLQMTWENLAKRYNMRPEELAKSMGEERRQEILRGWAPEAERQLKRELVFRKIEEGYNYQPTEEEIQNEIEKLSKRYNMGVDKLKSYYQEHGMMDDLKKNLIRQHTIKSMLSESKVKKGKKFTYKEFIDGKP
jgi:trigger factor